MMDNLSQRLWVVEGQIEKLNNLLRTIPRGGAVSPVGSQTTMIGSLVTSLKKILNLGFVWVGYKVNIKVRDGFGINLTINGLALKKQVAEVDVAAVNSITAIAGSDALNMADLNTKLATLVSEINLIKTKVNNTLAKARLAEWLNL